MTAPSPSNEAMELPPRVGSPPSMPDDNSEDAAPAIQSRLAEFRAQTEAEEELRGLRAEHADFRGQLEWEASLREEYRKAIDAELANAITGFREEIETVASELRQSYAAVSERVTDLVSKSTLEGNKELFAAGCLALNKQLKTVRRALAEERVVRCNVEETLRLERERQVLPVSCSSCTCTGTKTPTPAAETACRRDLVEDLVERMERIDEEHRLLQAAVAGLLPASDNARALLKDLAGWADRMDEDHKLLQGTVAGVVSSCDSTNFDERLRFEEVVRFEQYSSIKASLEQLEQRFEQAACAASKASPNTSYRVLPPQRASLPVARTAAGTPTRPAAKPTKASAGAPAPAPPR